MTDRQWVGTTFGSGWMHRCLIWILQFLDVRVLYAFCDIFVVPMCLVFSHGRKTAFSFYYRKFNSGFLKSCWMTYRNHCLFSQVVIDRFAMYAGKRFEVELEGDENFQTLYRKDYGFVQLSSHIGNYEIAGYSLPSEKKCIHAVVYSHEKESVMQNRGKMFGKTNVSMIAIKEDMSHLFEINQALGNGDIVSFPTDRHIEGARCVIEDFLGSPARFPQGPFSVATMESVDVLAVNVMKVDLKKYRIYLTPLRYDKNAPRKEQISQLCTEYVKELERIVRKYPLQWYNYFDFWA